MLYCDMTAPLPVFEWSADLEVVGSFQQACFVDQTDEEVGAFQGRGANRVNPL